MLTLHCDHSLFFSLVSNQTLSITVNVQVSDLKPYITATTSPSEVRAAAEMIWTAWDTYTFSDRMQIRSRSYSNVYQAASINKRLERLFTMTTCAQATNMLNWLVICLGFGHALKEGGIFFALEEMVTQGKLSQIQKR